MKFRTRTSGSITKESNPGKPMSNTYSISIDEFGHKTLQKTGETNSYEKIQVNLENSKITNIIKRFMAGDETALNSRMDGQYIDCTEMPISLADAQNKIIQITNEFNKLPIEKRREFDFSVEKYISEFGSKSWLEKIGITEKPITEQKNITPEGEDNE